MDGTETLLVQAREAYARGDWAAAHRDLTQARDHGDLSTEDLDRLGSAAWWVGEVGTSLSISEDVFRRYEAGADSRRAAMKAVDLALLWMVRGDLVIASGWTSRARRLLSGCAACPELGYLQYLDGFLTLEDGDLATTRELAGRLDDLGQRTHTPALSALGRVLAGLVDVREGHTAEGFAQLDEAMLTVLAGGLSPAWAGEIYCTVIHACYSLADLPRMRAWTQATEQWCHQFQGEVVYSGICRVHRLQMLCIEGHWAQAETAVERNGAELVGRNNWVAGEAYYQLGEIRRLRGDGQRARAAYDQARKLGTEPQPGLALLDRAEGKVDDAWAGLCSALAGRDRLSAAGLLGAAVGTALELGLREEAEHLCAALEATSATYGTVGFRAWAAHARAVVLLAQSRYEEAVPVLRSAAAGYRTLGARYEAAQTQELMARADRGLGREGAAAAEEATALAVYRMLGAIPDVQRLGSTATPALPGGLTDREADVLRLIAKGSSNRAIAHALVISEKTVSRHLSNIFAKIDVSSRTAAAAWAHEHGVASGR